MRIIFLLCLLMVTASQSVLFAQAKTVKKATTTAPVARYKPPKLFTILGNYKDSIGISAGEAEAIISQPIHITDEKKNEYTITSYQFLYKKNAVTEDEQSGKVSPTSSIIANRFKTSPLPAAWVDKVREGLRKGELIYFFDIVVMDSKGRLMFAPELKFTIL